MKVLTSCPAIIHRHARLDRASRHPRPDTVTPDPIGGLIPDTRWPITSAMTFRSLVMPDLTGHLKKNAAFLKKLFLFSALNSKSFEKMSRSVARTGDIFALDIIVSSLRTLEIKNNSAKQKEPDKPTPNGKVPENLLL